MELLPSLLLLVVLLAREYITHLERKAWDVKETDLLQRIQAPEETVMAKHMEEMPAGASPMPVFSDEDLNELMNRIG